MRGTIHSNSPQSSTNSSDVEKVVYVVKKSLQSKAKKKSSNLLFCLFFEGWILINVACALYIFSTMVFEPDFFANVSTFEANMLGQRPWEAMWWLSCHSAFIERNNRSKERRRAMR